jgi:hypothetical protein
MVMVPLCSPFKLAYNFPTFTQMVLKLCYQRTPQQPICQFPKISDKNMTDTRICKAGVAHCYVLEGLEMMCGTRP